MAQLEWTTDNTEWTTDDAVRVDRKHGAWSGSQTVQLERTRDNTVGVDRGPHRCGAVGVDQLTS